MSGLRDVRALAAVAFAVVAIAIPSIVLRHVGSASASAVAPLTATDRRALLADRPLVNSLPAAFAEVPAAAARAAGHGTTTAEAAATLHRVPALSALAAAADRRSRAVSDLLADYRLVLDGQDIQDLDRLTADLGTLQSIEADVLPTIQVAAGRAGHPLDDAAALAAVERDPHSADLARLLSSWQQVYGAFVLVAQDASR